MRSRRLPLIAALLAFAIAFAVAFVAVSALMRAPWETERLTPAEKRRTI